LQIIPSDLNGAEWLAANDEGTSQEIEKHTQRTRAWFACVGGTSAFVKWFPTELVASWARVEVAITAGGIHPAIIPIQQRVDCRDGTLLIYDRIHGENLATREARLRFSRLPVAERLEALLVVCEVLAGVCDAGFAVVDWYEGNMLYDFDERRIWLFDWELCRDGGSFVLEMESNYGTSRLMAPEEFVRGSRLDQATLVFNLGRYVLLTVPELMDVVAPAVAKATYPSPAGRFTTVRGFLFDLREGLATFR
jgi:serine/threonine-protein kinase